MVPIKSYYIHIPFCLSKCLYCGFNSVPAPADDEVEHYCRALCQEIREGCRGETSGKPGTIYIGGGTPTVLNLKQLSAIMSVLSEALDFDEKAEVTIEANPETVDFYKLSMLRDMGFNRLSIGIQSFRDEALSMLGRAHSVSKSLKAFEDARKAGFENIGIDLIYGLPGQKLTEWRKDLLKAAEIGPEHISAYSLTYEPGTEFIAWQESGRIIPCDDDMEAEMFMAAREILGRAGFEHYEVSNYAKPGFRSRHNLNYWQCGNYLGFGAGAHSHLGRRRWANQKHFLEYIKMIESGIKSIAFEEELDDMQQTFEAIFLGLRMVEGIEEECFRRKWGRSPTDFKPETWEILKRNGLVEREKGRVHLTEKGLLIADYCASLLCP